MKIVFLLPVLTQPRFQKRIEGILRTGYFQEADIKIISFERDYIPTTFIFKYESLGILKHGSYISRIKKIFSSLFKINKVVGNKDIIYCFGLDMTIMAYIQKIIFFKKNKIIYEVADIREICLRKNFMGKVVRSIEKFLVKRIHILTATSSAYISEYYKKILKIKKFNYIILENKILYDIKSSKYKIENDNYIKVGYFGLLRDPYSWEMLKRISLLSGFRVIIYGYPFNIKDFNEDLKKFDRIEYRGTYDGYNDMYKIYNEVDIVWAVYPYSKSKIGNWRWARTNRFYESCYFKKPLITSKDTQDALMVMKYDIGLVIDLSKIEESISAIKKIDKKQLKKWNFNLIKLPEYIYKYTDEHDKLVKKIIEQ